MRRVVASCAVVLFFNVTAAAQKPDLTPLEVTFKRVAGAARGRVGAAVIHLESGAVMFVAGDERFPMASVVKLPIALEVLKQVAERKLTLDRSVWLEQSDIRPCCTLERRHPKGGAARSVDELLALALVESDNTAADALLKLVGGAGVVQRRLRAMGFHDINVDRTEGQLLLDMAGVRGAPPPGEWTIELQRRLVSEVDRSSLDEARARYLTDPRDTATPYGMAKLLGRLQLGDLLPRAETELLLAYMQQTTTGARRIRARLPAETLVAHKTGTTAVVINDAGIITLPADSKIPGHVVLIVFVAGGSSIPAMERSVAQLGAETFEFFTGKTLPEPPVRRRSRRR